MLQIVKSYLTFLWYSKNQHGVHSPFVYDLVTKCFYNKKKYPEYKVLDDYRNSLLQNSNTIEVTDFGAGSRVFKSNTRAINRIANNAGISRKRAQLLFRIVNYFQPEEILEIGTSLGLATSALSLGNPNAKITTLEGCPNTMEVAKNSFQVSSFKFATNNIEFVTTEFTSFFNNLKPATRNPQPNTYNLTPNTLNPQPATRNSQLIYFDGNHSQKATLEYFELLLPTVNNNSIWIFDDIHWSEEMENAWEIIKNHPKVTVTIDTFQWGVVFFRIEQEKEHFVIRV